MLTRTFMHIHMQSTGQYSSHCQTLEYGTVTCMLYTGACTQLSSLCVLLIFLLVLTTLSVNATRKTVTLKIQKNKQIILFRVCRTDWSRGA